MKKFEFGLFVLCVLVGGYVGSFIGVVIATCAFMMISGIVKEVLKKSKNNKVVKRKEIKDA